MKHSVFLVSVTLVFTAFVALLGFARERLSPARVLSVKLERAEQAREEAEFKAQIAAHQLADYQQHVATLLPGAIEKAKDPVEAYPLRQLASLVTTSDALPIERASGHFEKCKRAFRDQLFEEASRGLKDLLEKYPESIHAVEAHFLLAETQYQMKDFEQSLSTIDTMIGQYPESELTGFALLRLGRIFEMQDRLEDAADVYRSVLGNFKQPELVKQAQSSLKAVAL